MTTYTDAELMADDFVAETEDEVAAQREAWKRRADVLGVELALQTAAPGQQIAWQKRQLYMAMAQFQAELPEVVQDSIAKVEAKSGAKFTYGYAGLGTVAAAVLPVLGRHGLAYVCTFDHRQNLLVGQIVHRDGGEMESTWKMPDTDDPQKIGSAMTYGRRYLLLCMTGAHPAGEDDDGAAAKHVHDRPRDDEPMTNSQRAEAQAVAPLAAVIGKGRQAGMTDGQIKADLDRIANGRQHGDLTKDELRQLFRDYSEAAKAVAELAEEVARQEAAAAEAGNGGDGVGAGDRPIETADVLDHREPQSTEDSSARREVGDDGVFVQAGEVVEPPGPSEVDTSRRPAGTGSPTLDSMRKQLDPKTSSEDFAAAQRAATDQLAKEGDDGRVTSRKRV